MLRSLKELLGYKIVATDGKIGEVRDFYFDDQTWTIRYHLVDTGTWLSGRRVLISPEAVRDPDWRSLTFPVSLTKEQVEKSPPIETAMPVSHQHETELRRHYGWPAYYPGAFAAPLMEHNAPGLTPQKQESDQPPPQERQPKGDPHLRSVKEVTGYHIEGTDGDIGHVEDFIADSDTWTIRYMVVDTRNWLPGRKVLVAPMWINSVVWADRAVRVTLPRETIKNSPAFDPSQPVNRKYEVQLYDYYGRPRYW